MRKLAITLGLLATLTSGCGKFNLNEMLASQKDKDAFDNLQERAQHEYDQGNFDEALKLTDQALAISPESEEPTILKGYVYLSKAGLDGFNISKKLIIANEDKTTTTTTTTTTAAKTGDTTTDNFNIFRSVMSLTDSDYAEMGTRTTIGTDQLPIYLPKSAADARLGKSNAITYLNEAIKVLCPLTLPSANPENDKDARHTCTANDKASANKGKLNFAWALAHLGEAIAFYSVILYDSDGDGIPNIQAAIPTQQITAANASGFLSTLETLNQALNAIFPQGTLADGSMLNALFGDLETASTALTSIPGIPKSVTDSVQKSIDDLNTKIAAINTASGAASAQNEALKKSLTTGIASALNKQIEESPQFSTLSTADQGKACCVYRSMNTTADRPSKCSEANYTDTYCSAVLASGSLQFQ